MLYPYNGARRREHLGPEGSGSHTTTDYGLDESGQVTYRFNSLGFRCEEFDPDAPVKLFVSGCSNTLGVGVEFEESWPFLFKQKLAEHRGVPESSVNLMNFAQGGASNDYVTRTLLEQSGRVRPDVIIAGFTHMHRFELFEGGMAFHIGAIKLEELEREGYVDLKRKAEFQMLGTDEVEHKMRMVKNILMLQNFCRTLDIPFVFLFFESWFRRDLPDALSIPSTQRLYDQIDLGAHARIRRRMRVDRGADGRHPGPLTQVTLAEQAWNTFRERYG